MLIIPGLRSTHWMFVCVKPECLLVKLLLLESTISLFMEAVILVKSELGLGITPESLLFPRNSPTMFVIEPQVAGSVPAKAHNKLEVIQPVEASSTKAIVSEISINAVLAV